MPFLFGFGKTHALALQLLRDNPPGLFGLDIVRLSEGRISRSSVYVVLGELEEEQMVRREYEDVEVVGRRLQKPRYFIDKGGRGKLIEIEREAAGDAAGLLAPV